MSSSTLKNELADHIYQYLCHEAQYSDLPDAARESLTAASECIEQAYKLNSTNNSTNNNSKQDCGSRSVNASSILPDELLRIFTRHKEFISQQKDSIKYPLRNENESSSTEKPDIRVNSHPLASSDSHNSNPSSSNTSPNINSASSVQFGQLQSHQQQQPATKQHNQHPISQLPMTTRKKLSHLRAQIKRQASKAARSRLEKRSSVSGVTSTSGSFSGAGHVCGTLGASLDAGNGSSKQVGDGYHTKETSHQPNPPSIDSPNAYSNSPSASSPAVQGNSGAGGSGLQDPNVNSSLSPGQNDGGASGTKQSHLIPRGHHLGVSVHQKNFKQKLIALIKKFRTDGSDFDSEEQYREALERELMKAAAGRGSKAIEELLEEEIEDVEGESGSEPEDWDNISESSTPKPSLRPFFSSTTLDKI